MQAGIGAIMESMRNAMDSVSVDPCSVYVVKDTAGEVIYVGITTRGHVRQAEHMGTKAWASEAATTTWEHHTSRAEAETRERALIVLHGPRYNTAHNPHRVRRMDDPEMQDLIADLKRLGRRRTRLRQALTQTSTEIREAARLAHGEGMQKIEIARLVNVSRPSLDEMLRDD